VREELLSAGVSCQPYEQVEALVSK